MSPATNCSVAISQNSRYLLINTVDGEPRMVDLDTQETVRTFETKQPPGSFIIRASYGGANESFVIHGSEGMPNASPQMIPQLTSNRWLRLYLAQRERQVDRKA
jgi:hypothetical protein